MSQISELEAQLSQAFDRLRAVLARRAAAGAGLDERTLVARVAELEDELERLRSKRDKDVAALDDLIAQLKPLIEEV